jgi:hypothetical protein
MRRREIGSMVCPSHDAAGYWRQCGHLDGHMLKKIKWLTAISARIRSNLRLI